VSGPASIVVWFNRVEPGTEYHSLAGAFGLSATDTGGITYAGNLTIEPAPGTSLTVGRVDLVPGGTGGPSVVFPSRLCGTESAGLRAGYLDVLEADHDGSGNLTSFAANLSLDCGGSVPTAEVRYQSTVPYADLASHNDLGAAYPEQNGTVTTTFTNTGSAAVTPGAARLTSAYDTRQPPAATATVVEDRCQATSLASGESCTVTVAAPAYGATVLIPVADLDDLVQRPGMTPAVTARATVLDYDHPPAVLSPQATGAVDGIYVSWSRAPGSTGTVQVERKTDSSSWTMVAPTVQGFSYADTSAPSDKPSMYRITPVAPPGPDSTGAATTDVASALTGWTAPAGADTYASVDGYQPVDGTGLTLTNTGVTVRGGDLGERPSLNVVVGFPGWRLGTATVGSGSGRVVGSWTDNSLHKAGLPLLSGTLAVTRLVLHADGTPAELAAIFTGTRRTDDGGTTDVSAVIVAGTTPGTLPGYLAAEVPAAELPFFAVAENGVLHTKTAPGMVEGFPVRLRNLGGSPVTAVSGSTESVNYSPPAPPSWATTSTCLNRPIPADSACTSQITYAAGTGTPSAVAVWGTGGPASAHVLLYADFNGSPPRTTLDAPDLVTNDAQVTVGIDDPQGSTASNLYCRLDDSKFTSCTSPWHLERLSNGLHTVTVFGITPTSAGERMSSWATGVIRADSVGPVTSLVQPSSGFVVTMSPQDSVMWNTDDPGFGTRYVQARTRTASATTDYTPYSTPVWAQASTANGAVTTIARGQEQCWSARAVDRADQWGSWSAERCLLAPLDDRSLASRGFARSFRASAFAGSVSTAHRRRASLSLRHVRGRQLGLVVTTCPRCGALDVFLAGARVGTLRTSSGRTRARVALWLPRFATTRAGTVVLRTRTSRPVIIDGLLVRHG
jgi:hypothetical protein